MNATGYRDDSPRTALAFGLSVLLHCLLAASLVAFFWRHVREMSPPSTPFEMVALPSTTEDSPAPADQPAPTASASSHSLAEPQLPGMPKTAPMPLTQPAPPTPPQPVAPVEPRPAVVKTTPTPPVPAASATRTEKAPPTPAKPAATTPPPATMTYQQYVAAHGAPKATSAATPSANPAPMPRYVPNVSVSDSAEQANLNKIATGAGRGTETGQSGAPTVGEKNDYLNYLAARLLYAFTLPPSLSGLKAEVTITISAQGVVLKRVINTSSGNKEFDTAVQAAMEAMTNVDPPPGGATASYNFTFVPSPK